MKAGFIAAAAALAGSASAVSHRHGHKHEDIFAKRNASVCSPGCTTIWTTIYGEATLYSPPQTATPTPSTTKAPAPVTTSAPIVVPTPIAQTCPTPGVYTFPATTVTLTETTTVCAATSTKVPSGTHTLGGVTTVVETATTVVCPYATVSTKSGGVVTSVIATTTYVCPSAGTYTIAPHTTTVTVSEEVVVYPVVTTYCPGTYTAPAVVTTVTETATVVYCPFTGTSTTAAPQAPAPVAPKPSTPAPPPATGGNKPAPGGSGDHWAITYTPYSSDTGSCKAPSEVMSDLQDLKNKGFTTVRVYSTDCDTLPNVGAACASLGLKMIIGVFVTNSGCSTSNPDITSQVSQITSWAQWNLVELIVIGNECVHNGFCSPADLQTLIVWVKSQVTGAGYTGTYTTAETVDVWQRSDMQAAICDVVDIVGGQIHAYFNAQTTPDQAGVFVKGQLDILDSDAICGGKQSLNLECGWPSECNCNGVACCGADNQSTAIASIREVIGSKVVFFSTHNDMWKSADTACGCEQFWGCSNLF